MLNVYGGNYYAIPGILEQMDFQKNGFQLERPFQVACRFEHSQPVEQSFFVMDGQIQGQVSVNPKKYNNLSKHAKVYIT